MMSSYQMSDVVVMRNRVSAGFSMRLASALLRLRRPGSENRGHPASGFLLLCGPDARAFEVP